MLHPNEKLMNAGETLIAIVAIILGASIVMVPMLALTLRFVARPLIETWARARQLPSEIDALRTMERRIDLLEKQVDVLERDNSRLLEEADFHTRLKSPI